MAAEYKEIQIQYIRTAFETPKNKPWYAEMFEKSDGVAQLVKNTETNGFYRIQSLPALIDPRSPTFSDLRGKQSGSRTYAFLYHIAVSLAEYARDSENNAVQKEMARIIAELHTAFHTPLIGGWTGILPIWGNIASLKSTFLGDPKQAGVFSDLGILLKKLVDDKTTIGSNLDKLLVSLYLCIKCIRLSAEGAPVGVNQSDFEKIDSLLETIEECHRLFLENKMAKSEEIIAPENDKEKEPASEEESSSEEEKENKAGSQESKERHIIRLFSDLASDLEDLDVDKSIAAVIFQAKDAIVLEIKKIDETEREGEENDSQKDPLDSMSESIVNIERSIGRLRGLLYHLNDPAVTNKLDSISRAIYHSLFSGLAEDFKQAEDVILFLRTFDPETVELLEDVDMSASKKEESHFEVENLVKSDINIDTRAKELSCVDPVYERGNSILQQDAEPLSSSPSPVKASESTPSSKFNDQKYKIDCFFCDLKEAKSPLELTYKECVANLRKLYIALCTGEIIELQQFRNDGNKIIDEALKANHGFSQSSLIKVREDFNRLFPQQSIVTSSAFFRKGIDYFPLSGRNDHNPMSRK